MANVNYEAMVVFSLKQGEEAVAPLKERFGQMIAQSGTLTETKEWGKRILKYPIQKETSGYYVLYVFAAEPAFPAEFQRVAGITDGVLRSLVTRRPELKPAKPVKPRPPRPASSYTPSSYANQREPYRPAPPAAAPAPAVVAPPAAPAEPPATPAPAPQE